MRIYSGGFSSFLKTKQSVLKRSKNHNFGQAVTYVLGENTMDGNCFRNVVGY